MKSTVRIASLFAAAIAMGQGSLSAGVITIDDFGGGPHLVNLTSLAPPEMATGTFGYAGAVGGVRDVYVRSQSIGIFSSGVAFGSGGYASFTGNGQGGLIWDGSPAVALDADSNGVITPSDFEYRLNLDLVGDCRTPQIHLRAFADLPGSSVRLFFGNSATDYAVYDIPLTTVGAFDDYFTSIFAPTVVVGAYDPTSVKTIAMLMDGTGFDNLDIRASFLGVECNESVPDGGTSLMLLGLGLTALGGVRRWVRR